MKKVHRDLLMLPAHAAYSLFVFMVLIAVVMSLFGGCADDRPDFESYLLYHSRVTLEQFRTDVRLMGYETESPSLNGGGYLWVEVQTAPLTQWNIGFHGDSVKTMFAYFDSVIW